MSVSRDRQETINQLVEVVTGNRRIGRWNVKLNQF